MKIFLKILKKKKKIKNQKFLFIKFSKKIKKFFKGKKKMNSLTKKNE